MNITNELSAQVCGCDPGAKWTCEQHKGEHAARMNVILNKIEKAPIARTFNTGATRDGDTDKLDYEGFLSPLVIERFGQYMHKHRFQVDGKMRDADNWQKGIPQTAYMKSGWRHFFDWWKGHRRTSPFTPPGREQFEETLCALMFNVMGYLHEHLKEKA